MTLLCLALHMSNDKLPETPSPAQILAFAIVTDKYDCVHTVRYLSRAWMHDAPINMTDEKKDCVALVQSAWLLNDPYAFRRSTKQLIPLLSIHSSGSEGFKSEILAEYVQDCIKATVVTAQNRLVYVLQKPIDNMTLTATVGVWPSLKHGKTHMGTYQPGQHDFICMSNYVMLLDRIGLSKGATTCTNIKEAISQLRSAISVGFTQDMVIANITKDNEGHVHKGAGCRACRLDLTTHFTWIISQLEAIIPGLCIDCMKNEALRCHENGNVCRKST